MPATDPIEELANPRANKATLASQAAANPELVSRFLAGLDHPKSRVRFGSARVLELVARQSPAALYPHFDFCVGLLDHPNRIVQWEAIRIVAHLVAADTQRRFDPLFRRFFGPIRGPVMITAANLIKSAAVIARARPEWADRLARQIMEVERARYQTAECRNVAIGHAVEALDELRPFLKQPQPALEFIRRQRRNRRPATRKKAVACLARWERSGRAGRRETNR